MLFFAGAAFSATPACSSAVALGLGMFLSLGLSLKIPPLLKSNSKLLMQVAIVAMGFSMSPGTVVASGRQGLAVTFVTLMLAMFFGVILARIFRVGGTTGVLISAGTGICGGSAIASMSPVLGAKPDEISVSMACVFFLNAVALILFPWIGRYFELTPEQFGWFAAIAIHDTSSVVGAATEFHPDSVAVAVTAKLTRALWIIPMLLVTASVLRFKNRGQSKAGGKTNVPWFIGVFVLAVILHELLPDMPSTYKASDLLGRSVMKIAIFTTGAQLTREVVKSVGPKAMGMAVSLWVLMSAGALMWIFNH